MTKAPKPSALPKTATVSLAGEQITIRPFTIGQLPLASGLLAGIISRIPAGTDVSAADGIELLQTGGEDLLQLLGLIVGKPRSYFDEIDDIEGVIALALAAYELNEAHFKKKLTSPLLTKLTGKLSA